MMHRTFLFATIVSLFAPVARAETVVFAAASLKEPVDRMAAEFGDVVVSYAGSGTLARQVGFGAPADIVLLANVDWMGVLSDAGDVQPDTVIDFASNRLVLIGAAGTAPIPLEQTPLLDALDEGRTAVGLTGAVPAGIYAKAALQSLGLWDAMSGKLAEVDSVRAALTLVARGQAPLGIVYQSDVRISAAVDQLAMFPEDAHPPIRYMGAVTTQATSPHARAFLAYVQGDAGQTILAEAGFLPPVGPAQ